MKFLFIIIVIFSQNIFSQKIDFSKKIKSIREKIEFISDTIQNYKLFDLDGDYGHSGFIAPKYTIDRFVQHWYNETFVHYINNKRNFNEKGLLIQEDWFDKMDEKEASYDYSYTEFDSVSKIREYNRFDNERLTQIAYNGKYVQSILSYWTKDTQNFTLSLNSYDEKNQIKSTEIITEEGHDLDKYYLYNKLGRITKVINHTPYIFKDIDGNSYTQVRDSLGTFYKSTINKYNSDGLLIEKNNFGQPEYKTKINLPSKNFYKYDKYKNIIEIKNSQPYSDMVSVKSFKYDYKKRKIFESYQTINFKSSFDNEKFFFYENDELKKIVIKSNGKEYIIELTYDYDSFGNWTQQTKSVNGKKLFIWSREIEYY